MLTEPPLVYSPTSEIKPFALQPSGTQTSALPSVWGSDGFSFKDLIDIVNPLQQLPVIGTIYRAITGDTISPVAKLAGGALFGGPIGLAAAGVDTVVEAASGQDVGSTLISMLDTPQQATAASAATQTATQLSSDSHQWFSLASLDVDPTAALDINRKAAGAYENAQKLTAS